MNKRGISGILAVVVFTLIAVGGVVVLWLFISKQLTNAEDSTNDPSCFTINLNAESCKTVGACHYTGGVSGYNADVLVKRGTGEGKLTGVRFIFYDQLDRKNYYDDFAIGGLKELETKSYSPYSIPLGGNVSKVQILALVGQNKSCSIISSPVSCTNFFAPPNSGELPPIFPANPALHVGYEYSDSCCQYPRNLTECYDSSIHGSSATQNTPGDFGRGSYCCKNIPGFNGSVFTPPNPLIPLPAKDVNLPITNTGSSITGSPDAKTQCSDGIDNDGDGTIDFFGNPSRNCNSYLASYGCPAGCNNVLGICTGTLTTPTAALADTGCTNANGGLNDNSEA